MIKDYEHHATQHNVGLSYPIGDIDSHLANIVTSNIIPNLRWGRNDMPNNDSLDMAAYYLTSAYFHDATRNDKSGEFTPFKDFEKLSFKKKFLSQRHDVLRFGCADEVSLMQEFKKYKECGIKINSHITVDISSIPLRRINMLTNNSKVILCDVSDLPFENKSIDLLVSDEILGSNSRQKESAMLSELKRIGKDTAQIIMRVTAGIKSKFSEDYGKRWGDYIAQKFGLEPNCLFPPRTKFKGLNQQQWISLGQRSARFINKAYYDNPDPYKNIGEVVELLTHSGFTLEEMIGNKKNFNNITFDPSSKGSFMIRASKSN